MSFRLKLFLSIVVAVVCTALIESFLDYLADQNRNRLEMQAERELRQYVDAVMAALALEGGIPTLTAGEPVEPPAGREGHFQITLDNELWLGDGEPFPEAAAGWARYERHLGRGYLLEVALERTLTERFVTSELFSDIVDLPVFFALAFGVAWLLTRLVMRPVRELTSAAEQLATQQFSGPLSVPPGNDELSQMARSFNLMSASIQGLLERERAFTRYASHELRTPLSALKVQVERAELGLAPTEKVMPALSRNIRRMEEVLSALLALARSSERDSEQTLLLPLIQELLSGFPAQARRRVTLADRTKTRVKITDAHLLYPALRNLLENAFRYSTGPVSVSVESCAETVIIRISDTGPGVPEDILGKLTKPFFRAGRHSESLGLGLSLVESIVHSLKGSLELRNTERGLEAVLTLPISSG
ncbi:MAG: HAMP domain-containing histidine kinase [Deinococcota bacterium]|nr:HAMP domain-containing histidine kinase [Deinococcota bacterium]